MHNLQISHGIYIQANRKESSVLEFIFDTIDTVTHFLDFRRFWRIYAGVATGFFLAFFLASITPMKSVLVVFLLLVILVPSIIGGILHGIYSGD